VLESFWSGVSEELARTWVARVLTPAFAFWVGGAALLWWSNYAADVAAQGWLATIVASATGLGELPIVVQGALVIGGLVLVATSALAAERLTLPVLRLLEGYWTRPAWLYRLLTRYRRWRRRRAAARALPLQRRQHIGTLTVPELGELRRLHAEPNPDHARLTALARKHAERELTSWEHARLGRDVAWLRTTPERDDLGMPTRLGDILRAAEHRPAAVHGIDAIVCWDALWQLLPTEIRTELTGARSALDTAVRGWLWGALFLIWTPLSWWVLAVGIGVPLLNYRFGILPRAVTFAELVVTSYNMHRMKLYDALHLPRPLSPTDERSVAGPRLTAALAGTLADTTLTYRFGPPTPGTTMDEAARGGDGTPALTPADRPRGDSDSR
jgi:hypothetical protein